jgi:hypothetical protein
MEIAVLIEPPNSFLQWHKGVICFINSDLFVKKKVRVIMYDG